MGGEATFTLTADIDPNALGTLSNTAGVVPPTGTTDPDSGDQIDTDTNTLVPTADLSVTKTDGSDQRRAAGSGHLHDRRQQRR